MKYLLFLGILIYSNQSAALVIWPSASSPCNTTLQTCVSGSPTGETIEIRTNTQINESITSTHAISLVAGIGYSPVFAVGQGIEMAGTSNADRTVSYTGLTFLSGRIAYSAFGSNTATTTLNISNNHIIDNSSPFQSIRINNLGTHTLKLNVEFNEIAYHTTSINLDRSGAISITNGSPSGTTSSGAITGRIFNNQIKAVGDESVGIGLYEFTSNNSNLDVSSNVLTGGDTAAMYVEKNTTSLGDSRLDFAHNAIYSNQIDTIMRGLNTSVSDGSLEINAINNSVVGAREGFLLQNAFGGIYDIKLYNNLVTQSRTPVAINNPSVADTNLNITFENDNNLFYNNQFNDPDFIVGPAHIMADPTIKGFSNARLRPGSPAIETADQTALFYIISVPLIDADGLIRLKNGNPGSGGIALDVGAYEAGDMRLLDTLKGSPSNLNPIESTAINANEFAKLQVTQNLNPNGISVFNGIDYDANFGVYDSGVAWTIFAQDQTTQMDTNTAFNVWSPAPSANSFVHTAEDAISASESFTEIDRSGLNNNPDAVLSVTQLWEGLYNDNPVGVFYSPFTNRWNIYNSNFVDMPWMAKFNVYFQPKSAHAFIHKTSDNNTSADVTYINHPLLNDSPCAQFQITYDSGVVFNPKTGVFYNQALKKWGIFNQGGELMPNSARFHVIVSAEQIAACNDVIFADGFE